MLRVLFAEVDIDGNGTLDRQEMAVMAQRVGAPMTEDELEMAMLEMDTDGDKVISFDEFTAWWPVYKARLAAEARNVRMSPERRHEVKMQMRHATRVLNVLFYVFQCHALQDEKRCLRCDTVAAALTDAGVEEKDSRARLQGCLDALALDDDTEIDFHLFIEVFSMVGLRDDCLLVDETHAEEGDSSPRTLLGTSRGSHLSVILGGSGARTGESDMRMPSPPSSPRSPRSPRPGAAAAQPQRRSGQRDQPVDRSDHATRGAKALLVLGLRLEGLVGERPEEEDEDDILEDTEAHSAVLHARVQAAVGLFKAKFNERRGDVLLLR